MTLRELSKNQKVFAIMLIFVCGLLFYANGIAFGLFASPIFSPEVVAFLAVAIAVALTIIILTIALVEKQKGIEDVKEADEAAVTVLSPVNIQEQKKIDLKPNTDGNLIISQEIEVKQKRVKLICPACRKEFRLPIYMKDLIVDYGPPKLPKIIRRCPYCDQLINLKPENTPQEDVWKE